MSGAETSVTTARVLSIQSHVVHGHVGNKSAVFPMQLLGLEVDFINSVQFSNHTGYESWKGSVMSGDELWELVQGLEANELLTYTHLLTGYIASKSFLETVARVVDLLRRHNPQLIYVCDPVMGDHGRAYVPGELLQVYRERLPAIATVLTPNAFEAEQLTGVRVSDAASAVTACEALHRQGTETVVVTSLDDAGSPDTITVVASTTRAQAPQKPQRLLLRVPQIPAYFTGTGDLLSALLLGWMNRHPDDLGLAVAKALGGLQAVLGGTAAAAGASTCGTASGSQAKRSSATCKALELRLIQSQDLLKDPGSLPDIVPLE